MKRSRPNQLTFWLLQRVCGIALLLAFWPGVALAQEPLSWPNRAPFVRLEHRKKPVLMPKEVVRVAQQHLEDVPTERWGTTIDTYGRPGHTLHVVNLFVDYGKVWMNFLVTRQSWHLLNDQNVACLNQVMEQLGRNLVKKGFDQETRGAYLFWLDGLVLGISKPLDDEFASFYLGDDHSSASWLEGEEKSADALRRYCHNVFFVREGGAVSFTYNSILRNGSVVQHTVHARVAGKRLELLRLETVQLRPESTFSFPDLTVF